MIFTINKSELQAAIGSPARIASRASVDYLACILITANSDAVTFEATDQVESSRQSVLALVESDGNALVSANKLSSIVKTLPDEAVTISDSSGHVEIECGKSSFVVPSLNPVDFPRFPTINAEQSIVIPFDIFAPVSKRASLCAAKNNKRAVFTGVWLTCDGSSVRMASSDGYRIIDDSVSANGAMFEAIIPATFIRDFASIKASGDVTISASDNQIQMTCGNSTSTTRLIDAKYPNIDMFFAAESNAHASVGRDALLGAARRASAIGSTNPVSINIHDGIVTVSRDCGENGSYTEDIEADCDGLCYAAMNVSFLVDALAAFETDQVEILLENPIKPIILHAGSCRSTIMPIRK